MPRAFLHRSSSDPHQFRFIVSADESARLADLKPFVRNLLSQMELDLDTKLDWIAVDHFNTGHPHTHIVIRGRDDKGQDLVMARDYIAHGVRARAQALVTLELGPENELERVQKLFNEVAQERLTRPRPVVAGRAKEGVLVITADQESDPAQRTLRIGRLKTLQKLGLAEERQRGVWALDGAMETKLRQLGDRADKFKMMQRALAEAGIDRGAAALALFERGPRKAPLIGKVVGVGMVDEITDRSWVVIDAVDGRVHYAELGRLRSTMCRRGTLVALAGEAGPGKPSAAPKLQLLSPMEIDQQTGYEGPTWLDQAVLAKWRPDPDFAGFGAELRRRLRGRLRWLRQRQLVETADIADGVLPKPDMMRSLRQLETQRLVASLSREFGATYVPHDAGTRINGIYERPIVTPTGKLALIRREDTFTLAPWKPALEPLRGQAVTGIVGPSSRDVDTRSRACLA